MIRIRSLTAADLPLALALSRQAGWNQTPGDWQRALDLQPDGCFAAEQDGALAGTATVCIFGPVAWVAMVLVDVRFRRRGIGRALMEHALGFLDGQGVPSVRLDATPLGQPLYEQLGFVSQFSLVRFAGFLQPAACEAAPVVQVPAERWGELAALDEAITRTARGRFLLRLFAEWPEAVRAAPGPGGWSGLLAARRGANAVQLGPCLGEASPVLLADAQRRLAGQRVYLDVPLDNGPAVRLAEGLGLAEQRRLTRMVRGEPIVENLDLLWASSGPEKG
jgi:ribosomal protein S18 acetylase RimI-like enzyme